MVIRNGRMGEAELDFTPVRGVEALSLVTRLIIESFSLAGLGSASTSRNRDQVRFVSRRRA